MGLTDFQINLTKTCPPSNAFKVSGVEDVLVRNELLTTNQVPKLMTIRCLNEVFARKEKEKKTGLLEHNKPCRLHHL